MHSACNAATPALRPFRSFVTDEVYNILIIISIKFDILDINFFMNLPRINKRSIEKQKEIEVQPRFYKLYSRPCRATRILTKTSTS